MLELLGKILENVQHGPQRKKVEQYLRNTTPDSLLGDLRKFLSPGLSAINDLWTTFEASSFQASPQEDQYWTKESLRKHIANAHPYTVFSDAAIDLLWTSFYFYAYHPFPRRDVDVGKIEWPDFQLSVTLLAGQGTKFLGTLEHGDYTWRCDVSFVRRANFNRILRSISRPEDPGKQPSQPGGRTTKDPIPVVDDIMDVLAMSQPQDINVHPSPDLLEPAAQALISRSATPTEFWINGKELSLLLSLILRLRLHKAKSTREFYQATFDEPCPQDDEFARIIANRLVGVQEINLTSKKIQKGSDLLSNLEFYFHQLWSTLFKPSVSTNIPAEKTAQSDLTMDRVLRVTSLFIGPHMFSGDFQTAQELPPITFHKQDNPLFRSLTDFLHIPLTRRRIAAVSSDSNTRPSSSLFVFLGNSTTPTPAPVIMGAYSPGLLWTTEPNYINAGMASWKSKFTTSHILFQLQPTFRVLKWTGTHSPMFLDFFSLDDASPHAYWIGAPDGTNAGLHIDTDTKMATLRTTAIPTKSGSNGRYEDIGTEENGNDREYCPTKNEPAFSVNSYFGFDRGNGTVANFVPAEISKDDPRYGHHEHENRVEGEELAKRIQGFGSKGLV